MPVRSASVKRMSFGVVALTVLSMSVLTPAMAAGQGAEVTFTKDVAPILQNSCQTCHRDGAIAPLSLMTFEETRPWARAIKDKVSPRTMPPWYIDKNIGVQGFRYDRSLSDDQIATIVAWVDAGAPRGNPGDMPPPREFAARDKWHIGEPDWIVSIPEPFVVPAEGGRPDGRPVDQGGRDEAVGRRVPRRAPCRHPAAGDGGCRSGRLS